MILPSILLAGVVALADGSPAAPATRTLGEVALAQGGLGLAPCGGEAAAVRDATATGEVAALVARLNGGADGSLFVDADIARDADGQWRVDRIRRAYRDGPRCGEDLGEFVWRAAGEAGPWTISVTRRYLTLRRADAPALFFRYRPFEPAAGPAWTFAGRSGPDAINVVLRPERCEDAVARRVTDWSIEFTLSGSRFSGCAWTGEPR